MFFFELGRETDGEHAFFGVAEGDGGGGGEGDIEVDPAFGGMGVEGHGADFVEESVPFEILPGEVGSDGSLLFAAFNGCDAAGDD